MSEKGLYIFSIQEFCNDIWNIFTNVTFVKYYKTNFFMKRDCRKSDETEPSVTHQSSKTFCCITLYLFLNCKFLEMCPFPTISTTQVPTNGTQELLATTTPTTPEPTPTVTASVILHIQSRAAVTKIDIH